MTLPVKPVVTAHPFPIDIKRPTPSYALASSATSVAALRLRSVEEKHVSRLRTLWLDAMMLELAQAARLEALARTIRAAATDISSGKWAVWEEEFRSWRSASLWKAQTDHAMEAAIASTTREQSGTDTLAARVQSELSGHASSATLRASRQLGTVIFLLTIAALVVPLLLHVSQGGFRLAADAWWWLAVAISAAVLMYGSFTTLRRRFMD
jgi:hypothetical protein